MGNRKKQCLCNNKDTCLWDYCHEDYYFVEDGACPTHSQSKVEGRDVYVERPKHCRVVQLVAYATKARDYLFIGVKIQSTKRRTTSYPSSDIGWHLMKFILLQFVTHRPLILTIKPKNYLNRFYHNDVCPNPGKTNRIETIAL